MSQARQHAHDCPCAIGNAMVTPQSWRQTRFIERSSGVRDNETVRQLSSVAERAIKRCPDVLAASLGSFHPGQRVKRRTMSNVLPVMAAKLSHPVIHFVLSEPGDLALHPARQSERARNEVQDLGRWRR